MVVEEILWLFSEEESGTIYKEREEETKRHEGDYCNHIAMVEFEKKVIRVLLSFPPFSKAEVCR